MAPVGRWQKNKDLSWYAKSDTSAAALSAAEQRKEEIRKIKEAEESALSEALGYGPTVRKNANDTPIGQREVERAIKETAEGDDEGLAKGVGFGTFDRGTAGKEESEVLGGVGMDANPKAASKDGRKLGDRMNDKRERSRSRDKREDRHFRRHREGEDLSHRRHEPRERSRQRWRDSSGERQSYRRERAGDRPRDRSGERKQYRRERTSSYERRGYVERPPRTHRERNSSLSPRRRRRYSRERDYDYRR